MNTTTFLPASSPRSQPAAAQLVLGWLAKLDHGALTLQLPDGTSSRVGSGEPRAAMQLHNWNVFSASLASGDIGLAETYMAGDWSTHDLPGLLRLLVRNRPALERAFHGRWWGRMAYRLRHLLNRNSRAGSRRNIEAHYDLGNAFYRLWLDETMNYSSALFGGNRDLTLAQAQEAKLRRALTAAGVRPGDRVLEIGCGWGAIAEMAACEFRAHVTGVTLSHEQLAYAKARLAAAADARPADADTAQRADLRLQDYRDIADEPFDAICSIEMVEAVGREYWPAYFNKVAALLKPGGRACIQTIVMADELWPQYIRGTDFIQQYVFPGGCLPCRSEFERHAQAAGLEVVEVFAFGADYAETLRRWREAFMHERAAVLQLGFDERFIRLWEFYLSYCEAAFDEGSTDVLQYTLRRR